MLCPHFENKVNCLVDILSILDKSKKKQKKTEQHCIYRRINTELNFDQKPIFQSQWTLLALHYLKMNMTVK